jgi:nitroreductase / dihydropteridine reductase
MTKIIDSLNWRYATKSFDTTKKVSNEDLEEIIEGFRLTASSFWLEPWKLIIVENEGLKNELVNYSFGQKQVWEASHVLVFTRVLSIDNNYVDKSLDNMSSITGASRENLKWYEDVIKWFVSKSSDEVLTWWAREQVFIALWNVMNVLAEKWIDSCAMWWFDSVKYDEVLWLKEKGLASVVVLPIWYRSWDDKYSKYPKVRFSREEIVEIVK